MKSIFIFFSLVISVPIFSLSQEETISEYNLLLEDLSNINSFGYRAYDIKQKKFKYDTQGSFEQTDQTLDLAIEGKGYFKLINPKNNQTFYTRNGQFKINSKRYIINKDRYYLFPKFKFEKNFVIDSIRIQDSKILYLTVGNKDYKSSEKIILFECKDLHKITRDNIYFLCNKGLYTHSYRIHQGFLERSNADTLEIILRMNLLLLNLKNFETNIKPEFIDYKIKLLNDLKNMILTEELNSRLNDKEENNFYSRLSIIIKKYIPYLRIKN